MPVRTLGWLGAVAALAACPRAPELDAGVPTDGGPPDSGVTDAGGDGGYFFSAVIGRDGGSLAGPDGMLFVIPEDAIDRDVLVSVARTGAGVYRFAPAGLVLARPALVRLPVTAIDSAVFWSRTTGIIDELGGQLDRYGKAIDAYVVRLGEGRVAAKTSTRVLWGVVAETHVAPAGIDNVFLSQATTTAQVRVPRPDGGWSLSPLVGFADGTFAAADVPYGDVYVGWLGVWTVTDTTAVDFGREVPGRADVVRPTSGQTVLEVLATNLSPWSVTDELQLLSVESGTVYDHLGSSPTTRVDAGSTVAELSIHPEQFGAPLIDAALGDRARLLHSRWLASDAGPLRIIVDSCELPPLTQTEGTVTRVDVACAAVPATEAFDLQVEADAFAAAFAADQFAPADAGPTAPELSVSILGLPGLDLRESVRPSVTVAELSSSGGGQRTFVYGLAPTSGWQLEARASYGFFAWAQLTPFFVVGFPVGVSTSRSITSGFGPFRPGLGPVRNPKVNGRDFFTEQSGLGPELTLSWDPSPLMVPPRFSVLLFAASANGANSSLWVTTGQNTVRLPAEFLTAGDRLVITVSAIQGPIGVEAPLRHFPGASANVVSAVSTW